MCLVFFLFQFSLVTNLREDVDLKNSFSSFLPYSKDLQNNQKVYIKKGNGNTISFSEYSYTERHKESKIVRDILKPTQVFTIYAYGSNFDDFASKDIFYGIIEDKNLWVIRLVIPPEGSVFIVVLKYLFFSSIITWVFIFFLWRDLVKKVIKNTLSYTSWIYDKDSLVSLYREIAWMDAPSLFLQSAYLVKLSERILENFLSSFGYSTEYDRDFLRSLVMVRLDENFILNKKVFRIPDEGVENEIQKQIGTFTYGILYLLKSIENKKEGEYTRIYQSHKWEFNYLWRRLRVFKKEILGALLDDEKEDLKKMYSNYLQGEWSEEILFSGLVSVLVMQVYSKEKCDFFYWFSLLFNPAHLILILVRKVYRKI